MNLFEYISNIYSVFEYISNINTIFTSEVNIPKQSENLVQHHNLIMKVLEEGAMKKFIFDKVAEENRKYIEEKKGEKVREMV